MLEKQAESVYFYMSLLVGFDKKQTNKKQVESSLT